MARYFKPVKIKKPDIDEEERGLNGVCLNKENQLTPEEHDWLLIPQEEGQKQYLICLKCGEYSHL